MTAQARSIEDARANAIHEVWTKEQIPADVSKGGKKWWDALSRAALKAAEVQPWRTLDTTCAALQVSPRSLRGWRPAMVETQEAWKGMGKDPQLKKEVLQKPGDQPLLYTLWLKKTVSRAGKHFEGGVDNRPEFVQHWHVLRAESYERASSAQRKLPIRELLAATRHAEPQRDVDYDGGFLDEPAGLHVEATLDGAPVAVDAVEMEPSGSDEVVLTLRMILKRGEPFLVDAQGRVSHNLHVTLENLTDQLIQGGEIQRYTWDEAFDQDWVDPAERDQHLKAYTLYVQHLGAVEMQRINAQLQVLRMEALERDPEADTPEQAWIEADARAERLRAEGNALHLELGEVMQGIADRVQFWQSQADAEHLAAVVAEAPVAPLPAEDDERCPKCHRAKHPGRPCRL